MAVTALAGEYELEDSDRPSLDHDTKGVAGAAEIAPVLFEKIASSAVFVADVTPVAKTSDGKALPNANVMIELGWSLAKPGWTRQIYVLNTATGFKPPDLPFDIRGRRTLTYALGANDDTRTRDDVRKRLIRDLTAAIRTNLNQFLEEEADARPIHGVSVRPDEPSLWLGSEKGFSHRDTIRRNTSISVTITEGPRTYLRVIPSGWKTEPPDVSTIGRLQHMTNVAPYAPTRHGGGDFGAPNEGYVNYWIRSKDGESRESEDLTMYFEETGEFWMISGSPIVTYSSQLKRVDLAMVFGGWARAIRRI